MVGTGINWWCLCRSRGRAARGDLLLCWTCSRSSTEESGPKSQGEEEAAVLLAAANLPFIPPKKSLDMFSQPAPSLAVLAG